MNRGMVNKSIDDPDDQHNIMSFSPQVEFRSFAQTMVMINVGWVGVIHARL